MSKLPLRVEFGSIYTEAGTMIDHMSIIVDKDGGLMKYGEKDWVEGYFNKTVTKFRKSGLGDIADNIVLITFDRYEGILTMDDVCTLVNYMILCSANGATVMRILNSDVEGIKAEIKRLKEFGY